MYQVTMEEASENLPRLLDAAQKGDEVIITRNNIAVAKIVTVEPEKPRRREPGSAKGIIMYMAEDFDETPEEFAEYL